VEAILEVDAFTAAFFLPLVVWAFVSAGFFFVIAFVCPLFEDVASRWGAAWDNAQRSPYA
jgi:dolichol kinase